MTALDELGRDVGLQVRERKDEIRLERLDLLESRMEERGDLRLLTCFWRPDGVSRNPHDPVAFAKEVQRLGGFLGEADDAGRKRSHGNRDPADGRRKFTSVNTNPSRSTVSPTSTAMVWLNIGPANAKEWNSPFSPHGSTSGGSSSSSDRSNARPANRRSSFRGSMQVSRACSP